MDKANQEAVANLRRYLQIPSVQPNIDYTKCIEFLEEQAQSLELPYKVFELKPRKPIFIVSWVGEEISYPSILLNSHMDVVPVYAEKWTKPPFGAEIDAQGNIYARGIQDMKSVGIQYLEAVRRLKNRGVRLKRTIHISFVPDEEIGGIEGMKHFVTTDDFKELNIGFGLDEGMTTPDKEFSLFYGERCNGHVRIRCRGATGHGSQLPTKTTGEKIRHILDQFMNFREAERRRLHCNPALSLGDVTSVNLTYLEGGIQFNIIPAELTATFDIRMSVELNEEEFYKKIERWCCEAGDNITVERLSKDHISKPEPLNASNIWWTTFKNAADQLKIQIKPLIFPGATDARYVREAGVPVFGFSPINLTPILLHDNDEYLNVSTFLNGINIYEKIITDLANVEVSTGFMKK